MRSALLPLVVALLAADVASAQFRVAFVDVQKVFAQYAKAEELQGQLRKDFDQMMVAQRREKEKVAAMKEGLELLVEGSKEQNDQYKKIKLMEIEIELKW